MLILKYPFNASTNKRSTNNKNTKESKYKKDRENILSKGQRESKNNVKKEDKFWT